MPTGERTGVLGQGATAVSFSPDGTTLASGHWRGRVQLWDVAKGTEIATLTGHTYDVISMAFSPDGSTMASGSDDGTILLWDTSGWVGGPTDVGKPGELSADRPDELIGKWESVVSGDGADTTRVLELLADGRFVNIEKTTSHESMNQTLVTQWGADAGRIQFVADSLAARQSRFHGALVADKQVFAIELTGAWGVEGNVIHAVIDSFSLSLNGLQGNDVFEFYEKIIPLIVPAENAGLVQLVLLGIALIQETFDAIIQARDVIVFGLYSVENDNLVVLQVVLQDETPVRYTRVPEPVTPDFDGDGTVGFPDFLQFASQFGQSQDDAGFDARFDLDSDGTVGFNDFVIFARSFGQGG